MATIDDFRKIEFRIATIKEVEDHPNADRLFVVKVDVGGRMKQVVAGIKSSYAKESLIGKQVVLVDNLDAAMLRGVESQGMILAATDEKGITIVSPERVTVEGSIVK